MHEVNMHGGVQANLKADFRGDFTEKKIKILQEKV